MGFLTLPHHSLCRKKANGTPYRRHTCHARSAEQRRDPRARHSWRCIRHQPRRNLSRHYSRRNTRRCVEAEPTPAQLCAATVSTGKCQRRTLLRKCHGAVLGAQNVPQRNCPKKMRRPRRPSALTFRGEAPTSPHTRVQFEASEGSPLKGYRSSLP